MHLTSEGTWSIHNLEAIYLSPTNHCNLCCPMCPNPKMTAKRGFLDPVLFELLVAQLGDLRADERSTFTELHFANDGEPFLHPHYLDMLEHLDRTLRGVKVFVSTNACLLDEAMLDRLLALRRNHYYLTFSLDASYQELYERIRLGGDLEKAQRNVGYVLERKRDEDIKNPYAVLQFIVMPENQHDQHNFYWQWEPLLGPVYKASDVTWWEGLIEVNRAHVFWKEFTAGWPVHLVKHTLDGENQPAHPSPRTSLYPYKPPSPGRVCAWPWRRVSIGWNGGVGLCCLRWESYGLLGNLQHESLQEIFEGEKIEHIRRHFLRGEYEQLPVCRSCDRRDWWYDASLEAELEWLKT